MGNLFGRGVANCTKVRRVKISTFEFPGQNDFRVPGIEKEPPSEQVLGGSWSRNEEVVPERGLEPPRGCPHMVLNHACLPISPLRHGRSGWTGAGSYRSAGVGVNAGFAWAGSRRGARTRFAKAPRGIILPGDGYTATIGRRSRLISRASQSSKMKRAECERQLESRERFVALERTEAVVLRGVDFSQSSRIVTFLCPERGRLTCMAKGVKRPRSALAGMLDTFNRLEIVYSWKESRGVQQLTECSLLDGYTAVKDTLEKSMFATFPLEIAYTSVHENEPSHGVYEALVSGLNGLEEWTGDAGTYCDWWVLRLLSEAGFQPAIRDCCMCGSIVSDAPGFSYDGGATCGRCVGDRRLSAQVYGTLRALSESEGTCPALERVPELFDALHQFATRQLEHTFRSARVLDQMYGAVSAARSGNEN